MNPFTVSSTLVPKRKRLSCACNYCRAKKTRCDEQRPRCTNCQLAGVPCITVDRRRTKATDQQRRRNETTKIRHLKTGARTATALLSPETTSVSPPLNPDGPAFPTSPFPVPRGSHDSSNASWDDTKDDTRYLPLVPFRAGASVVQMSTRWLDLALSRLHVSSSSAIRVNLIACSLSPNTPYKYAVALTEPGLPPVDDIGKFVKLYLKIYDPIYPFLEYETLLNLHLDHGRTDTVESPSRSMLLYLIVILGSMASLPVSHERLDTYLAYCHSLVGYLILYPVLESVQALLLFSITLRLRDQLSQAWDVLTLAVSMSQTLGLNALFSQQRSAHEIVSKCDKDSMRTWWVLCVFEKFLAFDSGRISNLDDPKLSSLGRQCQTQSMDNEHSTLPDYQRSIISLANILNEMQHRSWQTWLRENRDPKSKAEAGANKIRAAGAIDTLLWKWKMSLPSEYHIATSSAANLHLMPQWAFLSFYYYQAVIVLYRNVLVLDWNELKGEIDKAGSGEPWHLRICNSPQICLEAAKEMINLQAIVTDAVEPSFLSLATSPLAAAFVLVVHIRHQPVSILTRTHFELMKVAMAISRQRHPYDASESPLNKALEALEQYVARSLTDTALQSPQVIHPDSVFENSLAAGLDLDVLESSVFPWEPIDWLGWDWDGFIPQA